MFKRAVKNSQFWLYAGLLLLFLSIGFYTYDRFRTDEQILELVQATLQEDFFACLKYYESDSLSTLPKPAYCRACELVYDRTDRLVSWTENQYLPSEDEIKRLWGLDEGPLLILDGKIYYQLKQGIGDQFRVVLIPLSISYGIVNEFVNPYHFLGRWASTYEKDAPYISVIPGEEAGVIVIRGAEGEPAFSISGLSPYPFRQPVRYAVLGLLVLALVCFAAFIRIYTLRHWEWRYRIDFGLLLAVLALRGLLSWSGIWMNYVSIELFNPTILAFDDQYAPSLGELTINIITLAVLSFILYTYLFRLSQVFYRKLAQRPFFAWVFCVFSLGASLFLLYWFGETFAKITTNSKAAIDFSNIFSTSIYSFLILLDVGILLLSIYLAMFILLRFNVLFGFRLRFHPIFLLVHFLIIVGFAVYLFGDSSYLAALSVLVVIAVVSVIYRRPFTALLSYDLPNHLLLLTAASLLITYNVAIGIEMRNEIDVEQISSRILGEQVSNTIFAFEKVTSAIKTDQEEIRDQMNAIINPTGFRDWLQEKYMIPNFPGYEVALFMYDEKQRRLDRDRSSQPAIPPNAEIPLQDRGERVRDSMNLYLVPNFNNNFRDLYVGTFSISFDSADTRTFLLELSPTSLESEGLYPSLSLNTSVYDEVKLVNSFDHAIYRNGTLYRKRGNSSFPIHWAWDSVKSSRIVGNYKEFVEPLETRENRLVVIRYERQSVFNMLTTFSFIFYYYVLAALLLLALPVYLFRIMRENRTGYSIPLRAKIRLGLLSISILPMFVIIVIISPFIRQRYYDQASQELKEKAARITNALGPDYLVMQRDALGQIALEREFRDRLNSLKILGDSDVNIYDGSGSKIYSTQGMIFESGLRSDLMNAEAYQTLRSGEVSEVSIEERIGSLPYYSAYKPIVGGAGEPEGYINVPFLAQRDVLESEIQDFLAFLANIYLLVFLLLNVVAVLLSNTITRPLAIIQQRLAATGIGGENKPIDYVSDDEIGAIVTAYNQMVEKLGESEQKLSQTQRELAWRQMARQVAHEIKNPLTPMKLSIQHLTRAWDDKSNKLQQLFPRVMQTLLVQIESLVRIANSFSEFARMPETVKTRVAVNAVLVEVVDLYAQHENAMWLIDVPEEPFYAFIDRDQLSRTFNNIIKNALQAIEENGIIHVSMKINYEMARIEIRDNGKGMSDEVKEKVFQPSFSTKTSGMGLGLAIVKRAIESSGGKIYFDTKEGAGTAFFIELPFAKEVEQALEQVNG